MASKLMAHAASSQTGHLPNSCRSKVVRMGVVKCSAKMVLSRRLPDVPCILRGAQAWPAAQLTFVVNWIVFIFIRARLSWVASLASGGHDGDGRRNEGRVPVLDLDPIPRPQRAAVLAES